MRTTKGKTDDRVWAIMLVGGDGERMKPLVARWLEQPRQKQYCTFVGSRSMFQHTLDRAAEMVPPEQIVAVAAPHHRQDVEQQIAGRPFRRIL